MFYKLIHIFNSFSISKSSIKLITLFFAVAYSLLINSCKPANEEHFVFKLGHLANEDHTWHLAAIYFDSILNARSEGRISITVYPSEQLGKEVEMIRGIKAEIADMTITAGTLQNWSPVATFSEMPFLIRDTLHLQSMVNGEIGKHIEETILRETGLRALCYFQRGPRYLTSNRPIKHPDDLNSLILRIPNVPSYAVAWQALGAKPTPMAFSEVFTSLQQGTVEAQENPMAMISSANFSEVQEYLNLTSHVISWVYVVIGEKQFQELPHDLKEILLEAAKDMQAYEHKLFVQRERSFWQELANEGMKFIEVDKDAFQMIGSTAVYNSLDDDMKKIYERIIELD